jgi:hypothetical protein
MSESNFLLKQNQFLLFIVKFKDCGYLTGILLWDDDIRHFLFFLIKKIMIIMFVLKYVNSYMIKNTIRFVLSGLLLGHDTIKNEPTSVAK